MSEEAGSGNQVIIYIMVGAVVLFALIVMVYLMLKKRMQKSEYQKLKEMQAGTKSKKYSGEVLFQKLYITYVKIPFLKRYVLKLRRRLEIIDIDDEYSTRRDAAKVLTKALGIIIPLVILTIVITRTNILLMGILLIFELFMIDTFIDSSVDKIDNGILKEQLDFFSEIRHAYHEYNMVEEAIYQTSQDDEKNISKQGERIHEILISPEPEMELEKYYDIAPNSFLKEFAGISYLTQEFGDRKVDGSSLYLKNVNNISQEMQLEILKRDKLNYVFQSLAIISIVPILGLEPLKQWAVGNFSFTKSWYYGKTGLLVQILVMILTFVCYLLVRKLKDNGSTNITTKNLENPWQQRIYKTKIGKRLVKTFMPKPGTKEHRKLDLMLKDSASPLKMEWFYVNRIVLFVVAAIATMFIANQMHKVAVDWVYTEPTTDYDIIGDMSDRDKAAAEEVTAADNRILDKFKGNMQTTQEDIKREISNDEFYLANAENAMDTAAKRIYGKLQTINLEYVQWFEVLLAFVFGIVGYMGPVWLLRFQVKMRQMEMEDEVMQFQTIILMLMRIERVNVEIILEWLERYSNIFKGPISRCLNNYEAGAWEALEAMKEEVTFNLMLRIIESLQAAVEKIPIRDAFEELDSERDYYQEKRKESNSRLIKKKAMIGRMIGFAPMIALFVGYLIIPLVFVGLTSMSNTFTTMMKMTN